MRQQRLRANGCSTFGSDDCMRVPSPAASTMVRLDRADIRIPVLVMLRRPMAHRRPLRGFWSGMETWICATRMVAI